MKYSTLIDRFSGEHRWLSNFWIYDTVNNISVEHHYQAAKTTNYKDWKEIMNAPTPALAKKYGRVISVRGDWDDIKYTIMHQLTRIKYATNEELRNKLLDTHGSYIMEGNHWGDTFWGVCDGIGENNLGIILMDVRDYFLKDNI